MLAAAGLDPLLIKGRVAAALYPERGLRPYGDIDFCFDSDQYQTARTVLNTPEGRAFNVDVHDGIDAVYGLSFSEVIARASMMKVGKVEVRVPCFEAHLGILCIHFLKHGWRTLGLCDIGAALESRREDVDWERSFGSEKRIVNWMACTIGLAHRLLGANYEGPRFARPKNLPRWLAPAVLRQWERHYPDWNETPEFFKFDLRKPAVLKSEIRKRWPNPIRATIYFGGSFNEFPRLPFQLGNFIAQGLRFLARLPRPL
jgi:hypothetical protein